MADVARLAGVSKQTVSRVLNDHPHVGDETRVRVEEAIRQLAYRRDASARALATRRSGTLGVLAFDTTLQGPPGTIAGMQEVARELGYFISISSLNSSSRDPLEQALHHLTEQAVEGVVVVASTRTAADLVTHLPRDLPVVTIEGPDGSGGDTIRFDQEAGARLATGHLLALGHETVHHIAGPRDRLDAERRVAGWRAALEAAGRPVPEPIVGDWSPRSADEAAGSLPSRDVTAVFAASDHMALGILHALRRSGRRVPEDVSVVGFDDTPEAAYFAPPLTSIHQAFDEIGRGSLRLLLDRIEDPDRHSRQILIPPRLVVRQSTSPPYRV